MIRVQVTDPRSTLSVTHFDAAGTCLGILLYLTPAQVSVGAAWGELARLTAATLSAAQRK